MLIGWSCPNDAIFYVLAVRGLQLGTVEGNWKNDLLLFNNEIRTSTCVATSVDAKPIYSFVRDRSAYMCELGLGLAIT